MSTPVPPFMNWEPSHGTNSPIFEQEWQDFLQRRAQAVEDIRTRWNLGNAIQTGLPELARDQAQAIADAQRNQQLLESYEAPWAGMRRREIHDLIGRARYYNIETDGKSPQEIWEEIEQRRGQRRDAGESGLGMMLGPGGKPISTETAMALGIGSLQSLTRTLDNLPFIGDWTAKAKGVQEFNRWLATIDEAVAGDMEDPSSFTTPYGLAKAGSGMLTYLIPGAIAWKGVAGVAGAIGTSATVGARLGPIGKTAIHGGLATAALEAGGDAPWQERGLIIGLGAGLSGGAAWAMPHLSRIMAKLQRDFPNGIDAEFAPIGQRPPTYTVVDEGPFLPGAQRQFPAQAADQLGPTPGFGSRTPQDLTGLPPAPGYGSRTPQAMQVRGELPARIDPLRPPFVPEAPSPMPLGRDVTDIAAQQVAPRVVQNVARTAANMSKQATIMESPNLPELARTAQFNDADVGRAALATNPGQVNIIRNVGDVSQIVVRLTRADSPTRLMPHQLRVVQRTVPRRDISSWTYGIREKTVGRVVTGPSIPDAYLALKNIPPDDLPFPTQTWDRGIVINETEFVPAKIEDIIVGEDFVMGENPITGKTEMVERPEFMGHTVSPEVFTKKVDDILISDGRAISNKMVKQYQEYGMFEGQQAMTVEGQEMVVTGFTEKGLTKVKPLYSNAEYIYPVEDLIPGRATFGGIEQAWPEAPQVYKELKGYVLENLLEESQAAGLRPFEWLDVETSSQLPRLIEDYLNQQGVTNPITRSAYTNYFNEMRVSDFRDAGQPYDIARANALVSEAQKVVSEAVSKGHLFVGLDEMAASKGFRLEPLPGSSRGFELVDELSDLRVPVETEETAVDFLRNFNREIPDIGEPGSIPDEVFEVIPGASHPGSSTAPVFTERAERLAVSETVAVREREFNEVFSQDVPGGAGSGTGGPPPPPFIGGGGGIGGTGGAGGLPPGPGEMAGQFRRRGAQTYAEVNDRMSNPLIRWMPTRNAMKVITDDLTSRGFEGVRLAEQYEAVSSSYVKMKTHANPWYHESTEIFSNIPRRHIRDGTLLKLMEIGDQNLQIDAMVKLGYGPAQRGAVHQLRDMLNRLFREMVVDPTYNLDDSRYVVGYMSRVRSRQMMGIEDAYVDTDGALPHHLKFFAEEFRKGEIDFREMHAEKVVNRLVRGAMFHKHVKPAWEDMAATWDHQEIPELLRGYVNGWLKLVHRGGSPVEDTAIVGFRQFLNKMGVPATNDDMNSLFGGMVGSMYRAFLGVRPDALLREAQQPWMLGIKHGFEPVAKAYTKYLAGGADRDSMIDYAVRIGAVEPGRARLALAGFGEGSGFVSDAGGEVFSVSGRTPEARQAAHEVMTQRRESINQVLDVVWSMMPRRARQGVQDTGLDPMLWYGKTTTAGKVVMAQTGKDIAEAQLALYRRGEINSDQLAHAMGWQHYGDSFVRAMNQLLHAGDDAAFVDRFASEVVAESGMRVGALEQPQALREKGVTGRLGMMFGNFSLGTLMYFNGIKKSGWKLGAASAARYAAYIGALGIAEANTGFKFKRWAWHQALWFSGGPAVTPAIAALQATRGLMGMGQGYEPSAGEREGMRAMHPTALAQGAARAFNPYYNVYDVPRNILESLGSPAPGHTTAGYLIAGERPGSQLANRMVRQTPSLDQLIRPPGDPAEGTGGFNFQGRQSPPPFVGPTEPIVRSTNPVIQTDTTAFAPEHIDVAVRALERVPREQWQTELERIGLTPAQVRQVLSAAGISYRPGPTGSTAPPFVSGAGAIQ